MNFRWKKEQNREQRPKLPPPWNRKMEIPSRSGAKPAASAEVLCHMTIPQAYRRLREQLSAVCGDFSDYEARRILEYFTGCGVRDFPWKLIENQPIDAGRRM